MKDSLEVNQREDARQVLRMLALGRDPDTGEGIVGHRILQKPTVIRALLLAIESLDYDGRTDDSVKGKHSSPSRAGMPWLPTEDAKLAAEFGDKINLQILAEIHERSEGAIAARLVHLKLVNSRDDVRDLLAWS